MVKINRTDQHFDPQPFFNTPLSNKELPPTSSVALFDQNGYSVTELEELFYEESEQRIDPYRTNNYYDTSYKKYWFHQDDIDCGCGLNHAWLFQRKGFAGDALSQLERWAAARPIFHKLTQLRPKWGIDFSIDYFDDTGVVFEVLHFEWDSFNFEEIERTREQAESVILSTDWLDAAKSIYKRKEEWHHLDFFAQSRWKTDYFNLVPERFKMVAWS